MGHEQEKEMRYKQTATSATGGETSSYRVEDAAAIQILGNEIVNLALQCYITSPAKLEAIIGILHETQKSLAASHRGVSREGCVTDADCPSYWVCDGGLCRPGKSRN